MTRTPIPLRADEHDACVARTFHHSPGGARAEPTSARDKGRTFECKLEGFCPRERQAERWTKVEGAFGVRSAAWGNKWWGKAMQMNWWAH